MDEKMNVQKTPGQIAFEAFNAVCGLEIYGKRQLPKWETQDERVKAGWEAAAIAVCKRREGAKVKS